MPTNFFGPLSSFLSLSQTFPKIPIFFEFSLLKLIFFELPMAQNTQSLKYSIKILFKDHFTENYGAFEMKWNQQNCC